MIQSLLCDFDHWQADYRHGDYHIVDIIIIMTSNNLRRKEILRLQTFGA